jgi:hypothetical protein
MRNFKTDKWYKVVIDYVDWYYTWRELREYFALDEEWVYVAYLGDRELQSIDDLQIWIEWINWLLWRNSEIWIPKENLLWWEKHESEENYKEDEEYYIGRYWEYEKDYELRPFYISYYGCWSYRVQFCNSDEAQWFLLIKRRKIWTSVAEKIWKTVFEHYIEWEFLYTQIYSPHYAEFVEKDFKSDYQIVYYDYEDGWIFHLDEKEAMESLPEYCWKILEKSESMDFSSMDLEKKEITDN